jgi:uncharacterized surface protein with fasciclin (FAS1) repeats
VIFVGCALKINNLYPINKVTLHELLVILLVVKLNIMLNVVDVVVADINLATMSRSIKAVELDTVLSTKGPFTLFAPTDLAFGKLQSGRIEGLMKPENKEKFTELLNHHIVEGQINYRDLKDNQKLVTANGRQLLVKIVGGKVTVNGAILQGRDSTGSNGVVHSLDTVIEMK